MMFSPNDCIDVVVSNHTTAAAFATGSHTVTDGTATAEADITIEAGLPAEGNTITIDASTVQVDGVAGPTVIFTFTATPTLPTHVEIGGDVTTTAQNLEDAIEDVANGLVPDYIASADNVAGVCTVIAAAEGRKGNAITLAKVGANITLEAAALAGGAGSAANNDTATVGTTVFTWKLLPTLSTHVEIGNTAEACATNLEAKVEAHATTSLQVTGATVARAVTWTALDIGDAGELALAEAGDSSAVSGAAMTGGVDPLIPAAGTGKKVILVAASLTLDTAGEILWQSDATSISGAIEVLADTPYVLPPGDAGWLASSSNQSLGFGSTTAANGWLRYAIIHG